MSFARLFEFERALSQYTGAPYVVVTDCCTHALELAMRYDLVTDCEFTAFTYLSVPQIMKRLGIHYRLTDEQWQGEYQFHGTRIWDSARRLERGMYRAGQIQCLSFGHTKPLELGRGGALLLDDVEAWDVIGQMRADGRDLAREPWESQQTFRVGWHYCPTLELCETGTRALQLHRAQCQTVTYPDCRKIEIS
jgi:dTDP-4-amino-4,6-dideoxygalactose transaminase